MSTPLDIDAVYRRGLADAKSLTPEERLVFLIVDIQICADMEGWDHFFVYSGMQYYQELIAGLKAAGDVESLEVLQDYEQHFRERGIAFESEAISDFLRDPPPEYLSSCRDWREDYTRLTDVRWKKVQDYLSSHGYTVMA